MIHELNCFLIASVTLELSSNEEFAGAKKDVLKSNFKIKLKFRGRGFGLTLVQQEIRDDFLNLYQIRIINV